MLFKKIKTNEIRKGTKVLLRNGFEAIIDDNKKGNIRFARVFGIYEELGSIYAHDICTAYMPDGEICEIELTPAQKKLMISLWQRAFYIHKQPKTKP